MWCVDLVRDVISSDAAAREEKSIHEVSRDIIRAVDFLDALRRKRKRGLLSIEFKVSTSGYFCRALSGSRWAASHVELSRTALTHRVNSATQGHSACTPLIVSLAASCFPSCAKIVLVLQCYLRTQPYCMQAKCSV